VAGWLWGARGEPAEELLALLVDLEHFDQEAVSGEERCFGHAWSAAVSDVCGMDRRFLLRRSNTLVKSISIVGDGGRI
jgi:hypothetical protein